MVGDTEMRLYLCIEHVASVPVPALFVFALYVCRGLKAGNLAGADYWRADDRPHFMPQFTVTKVLSRRRRQITYGIEELFVFLVKMIVIQIIFNSK